MINKVKKLNKLMRQNEGRLFLFGASVTGEKAKKQFDQLGIKVEAFIDNDDKKQNTLFGGVQVFNIAWLEKNFREADFVVVSSNKYSAISKQLAEHGIKSVLQYSDSFISYVYNYSEDAIDKSIPPFEKSIRWILNHMTQEGGVSYSSLNLIPYPEVTGYIVPTLVDYGYVEEGKKIVKWLLSIQQQDGGFCGPSGSTKEYVFDTAQILRGLLCYVNDEEIGTTVYEAINKACDYLLSQMVEEG